MSGRPIITTNDCFRPSAGITKAERKTAHRTKMDQKKKDRERRYERARRYHVTSAGKNRNTGKPHEHKREIARRLRQQGRA